MRKNNLQKKKRGTGVLRCLAALWGVDPRDPRLERARRPLVFEGPLPDGGTWTEVAPEHYVLLEGGGAV